jgi:AraC-like DNA-binding protein
MLGLSRTRLSQLFQQEIRETAIEFIKRYQIDVAEQLLRETDLPIAKIAYRAAFGTRRTFHRAFVRATGMTPHAYRLKSSKCL